MAERDDANSEFPGAPELVAPRNSEIISGESVRFEWEPVEDAFEYQIEVASDSSFETVVFEENVGDRTEVEAPDALPADGQTYYWRVLARDDTGWSSGDRVESFVSGTPEDVEEVTRHPEGRERPEEDLGPPSELVKSAGVEAAAEATGDEELFAKEREMGVAHEGVEAGQIIGIAAAIGVAFLIIIPLLLFIWFGNVTQETRRQAAAGAQNPELQRIETEATRLMNQYEIVDEEEGIYRIPVDRAMQQMVEQEREESGREYSPELPLRGSE